MPSLPELSGDINKDLSPLTGSIEKDLGTAPASPLTPQAPAAPTTKDRAEQVAQQLERGPETLPGLARMAGFPEVAKWLPGDYTLQQQLALPQRALAGPLKAGSAMIGKVLNPGTILGRAATQGALGAVEGGLEKKPPLGIAGQAAAQAGGSLAGDAISGAARYLYSAAPKRLFQSKSGRELGNWLRQNVPAWSDIRGPRALYQMSKEGMQPLQEAFEKEYRQAVNALPADATIEVGLDVAKKAGIKNMVDVPVLPSARGFEAPKMVKVPARAAAEASLGLKDQSARGALIDALSEQAPSGWIPEARRAYQLGKGWQDFSKTLFKGGEKYDALKAQELLRGGAGQALESRGMQAPRDIIRGPVNVGPLKQYQPSPWAQRIVGLGLLGGAAYGHNPGLGALGAALELAPRMSFYRGVPKTGAAPAMEQARRVAQQALIQRALQEKKGPLGP